MKKITAKQLTLGILLTAFLLRLPDFLISFAYDEIWTLSNFSGLPVEKLLFDLSLPNNQPLNSILVKAVILADLDLKFIRLPSLFAGLLSLLLAGWLCRRMTDKNGALWCMFFMALNGPLAVYSVQARGYSLQVLFLLLFACSLIKSFEKIREKKHYYFLPEVGIIISALFSVMTLPTSILYLAGITLLLWNYGSWKIPSWHTIAALFAAAIMSSGYLLLNYSGLQSARVWGTTIDSFSGYLNYLGNIFYQIIPGVLILPFFWYLAKERKYLWGYAGLFLLVFGSALLTNGGPGRVYLPLCCLFCITAGAGTALVQGNLQSVQSRQILLLAAVLAAVGTNFYQMKSWRFSNYYPVLNALNELPAETLTVYPAGDCYSVIFNSNGKAVEYFLRSVENSFALQKILIINSPGRINGSDIKYNEKNLPLEITVPTVKIEDIPAQYITLEKCRAVPDGSRAALLLFHSSDKAVFDAFCKMFYTSVYDPDKVLRLNQWFTGYAADPVNVAKPLYAGVWYVAPEAIKARQWQELYSVYNGAAAIYSFKEE